MKKAVLILFIAWSGISLHAQETSLTLEVIPGELASQLTKEQKQTVTDLILTGNLNKEDFYFMRDSLPVLKNVDLKHTKVDTIPKKAFFDEAMEKIILPLELKYIDEDAFSASLGSDYLSVYVTGKYPGRAAYIKRVMGEIYNDCISHLKISENNQFCKEYCGAILSSDGKILYDLRNEESCDLEEGLEIIESYALVGRRGYADYTFPSTLKLIKKYAFYNWSFSCITGSYFEWYNHHELKMKATTPPVLEKEAFVIVEYDGGGLTVPNGCSEIYRNADPQWNIFFIVEETGSSQSTISSDFSIMKNEIGWQLSNIKTIKQIDVYTTLGHLVYSMNCNNTSIEIPMIPSESIIIVKVFYENGNMETLKLIS